MKTLIIDKQQKIELANQYSYALTRIGEELEKKQIPYRIAYWEEISFNITDNKFSISIGDENILDYTHIILRGHRTQQEYEIKRIIVDFVEANKLSIKVLNSEFIKTTSHYSKMYQALICATAGINYIDSKYLFGGQYAENLTPLKFPVIAKHYFGKNRYQMIDGKLKVKKNIYLINKSEDFKQEFLAKQKLNQYFVQEFIDSHEDMRIIMNKSGILTGFSRKATKSFLTVSGGEYTLMENFSVSVKEICAKAQKAFKFDFAALDIMFKGETAYLLEVNMAPGFKAYETKVPGSSINIAKEIVEATI